MIKNSVITIDKFPLNSLQKGMLFHSISEPTAVYINQAIFKLLERINKEAMENAISALVEYHDILTARVNFESLEIEIPSKPSFVMEFFDLSNLTTDEQEKKLHDLLKIQKTKNVDDFKVRLIWFSLIKFQEDEFKLILTYHHLLFGGTAAITIARDIFTFYGSINKRLPAPLSTASKYKDHYLYLMNETSKIAEEYWKKLIFGFKDTIEFPANIIHLEKQASTQQYNFKIKNSLYRNLKQFCKNEKLTPNIVFQFTLLLILAQFNDVDDVILGVTHEIKKARKNKAIGLQINTLPMRLKINTLNTVKQHLLQIREQHVALSKFSTFPLDEINKLAKFSQNNQVFDVLFNFIPHSPEFQFNNPSYPFRSVEYVSDTHYPFVCDIQGENDYFKVIFSYKNNRYDSNFIVNLASKFHYVLAQVIKDSNTSLNEISLLTTEERQKILYNWQGKKEENFLGLTVDKLVEEQAAKTPNAVAVIDKNDQTLTYNQLQKYATVLAENLHYCLEGKIKFVAIYMERCKERIIALYGIIKAGAAYVPIEVDTPSQRVKFILEDSQASVIITQEKFSGYIKASTKELAIQVISIDSILKNLSIETCYKSNHTYTTPIYVMYTSGTTGKPKGVINLHQGLANQLLWLKNNCALKNEDIVLHRTSIAFDASFLEIFSSLISGSKIVLLPDEWQIDTFKIIDYLQKHRVTILHVVPSLLKLLLQTPGIDRCLSLKQVFCIGEPLLRSHQELFFKIFKDCQLYNLYGPVEAAIDVTSWACQKNDPVIPIGRPIANTQVYVLNKQLKLVPSYVRGEICIAGVGVASGYLNNKSLTNEKFVKNIYANDSNFSLYKTGDIGYWLPEGTLQYVGRYDNQVKIRGHRVELEEIESILKMHPNVKKVAVIIKKNELSNSLLAYIISNNYTAIEDIKKFVQLHLPTYMIPEEFIFLDSFPVLDSGKIDRNALTKLQVKDSYQHGFFKSTKKFISQVWSSVLKNSTRKIHLDTNFFDIGGNSLSAVQVSIRLSNHYHSQIPIQLLYEFPILAKYCQAIMKLIGEYDHIVCTKNLSSNEYKLSSAQKRLWFLYKLDTLSPAYNMSISLQLMGPLNLSALEFSFHTLIERHPSLRTIIRENINGEPIQIVSDNLNNFHIAILNKEGASNQQIEELIKHQTQEAFNLSENPGFAVILIKLNKNKHILFMKFHHLFIDGWSLNILSREISIIYGASINYKNNPLKPITVSYSDYIYWQQEYLKSDRAEKEIAFWANKLQDHTELSFLDEDLNTEKFSFFGERIAFTVNPAITKGLLAISEQIGCTPFATTLLAFALLMCHYFTQEEIVLITPVAGRIYPNPDIENIIGCFINLLPIRLRALYNIDFLSLLKETSKILAGILSHQEIPFEKIVEVCENKKSRLSHPLSRIMFVYQNFEIELPYFRDLKTKRVFSDNAALLSADYESAKLDISCYLQLSDGKFQGLFEYKKGLFSPEVANNIIHNFQKLLTSIVDNPTANVVDLNYISSAELKKISFWNKTKQDYPKNLCIHQLFQEQVKKTPNAIALIYEEQKISYLQLDNYSTQLANYIKKKITDFSLPVAVCLDRSLEMIYTLFAILKTGCAYLPIDPEYPEKRIQMIINNSSCSLAIIHKNFQDKFVNNFNLATIVIDKKLPWQQERKTYINTGKSRAAAYVIYTSGSTGEPKGVVITHRSVVNRIIWMQKEYQLTVADVVLQKSPYFFDVSVWEIFWTLTAGAQLCIAKPQGHKDTHYLVETIVKNQVTTIDFVPSMLEVFLNDVHIKQCISLSRIFSSGEKLPLKLQKRLFNVLPHAQLYNAYGPTEATVEVTHWKCDPATHLSYVPIGKPIDNVKIHILDGSLQAIPIGVVGEICISGDALSIGYLNNQSLTDKFFVKMRSNERIYKTGDLGCWLEDGNIRYLGRADSQLKLRGFRIELGEITAKILEYPGIDQAVIECVENQAVENKYLIAYFTPVDLNEKINKQFLLQTLAYSLPSYMLPAKLIQLESIPLLPSGKVDHGRLKQLVVTEVLDEKHLPLATATQRSLAKIWSESMDISLNRIGLNDNFFELGGHSLLAIKIVHKIEQFFKIKLPLNIFFIAHNFEELAKFIDNELMRRDIELTGLEYKTKTKQSCLITLQSQGEKTPIFLFHPVGGTVFCYMDLVRSLHKDRPCYAFQDPGLESHQLLFNSLSEMAEYYRKIIQQVQSQGPYILAGGSFGGTLAMEVANQLIGLGKRVSIVALFDSWALYTDEFRSKARLDKLMNHQYHLLKTRLNLENIPDPKPLLELNWHRMTLWLNYKPRKINNELTLFKAKTLLPEYIPIENHTNHWQQYSTLPMKVFLVPGDHETIFLEPNAKVLAKKFNSCLEALIVDVN